MTNGKATTKPDNVLAFVMPNGDDPRHYLVWHTSCGNSQCEFIHLTFVQVDENHNPISKPDLTHVPVNINTWEIDPDTKLSKSARPLAETFLESLGEQEMSALRESYNNVLSENYFLASMKLNSSEIRQGMMVSYSDAVSNYNGVRTGGANGVCHFSFEYEGHTYLIDDLYCPNPDCDCQKAHLIFLRLKKRFKRVSLQECFDVTWNFSGSIVITKTFSCSKSESQEILAAFQELDPDVETVFRDHYHKIQEIGKRNLISSSPETSSKVGRNTPCPCGSGLKYKKCCG